jgi:acetyl-CoA synthetase
MKNSGLILLKELQMIYWANKPEKIFEWDYSKSLKWFIGGYVNACYSVANYRLKKFNKNAYIKNAYIHVNTELGLERKITYSRLYNLVCEVYEG